MAKIRILEWDVLYVQKHRVTLPEEVEVDVVDQEHINIAAEEAAEIDINNFGDEAGIVVVEWEEI